MCYVFVGITYFSFSGLEMVQLVNYFIGLVLFSVCIVGRDPQGFWKDNTNWDTLVFPIRTGTLVHARIVNNKEKKPVLSNQQLKEDTAPIATGANNIISSVSRQPTVSSTISVHKSPEKQPTQSPKKDPFVLLPVSQP